MPSTFGNPLNPASAIPPLQTASHLYSASALPRTPADQYPQLLCRNTHKAKLLRSKSYSDFTKDNPSVEALLWRRFGEQVLTPSAGVHLETMLKTL
jgi:hypothetical protein